MSDKTGETNHQSTRTTEQKAHSEPVKKPGTVLSTNELLQAQKIELEMQNEELRQAQVALELSRAHYIELYDFAPVGYLTLTAEGMISQINLTGAKLLGVERKKLINQRFANFIPDQYKDLWHRHFIQAKQSNTGYGCELPYGSEKATTLYAHLDCLSKESTDHSQSLRVTLTDVSERKKIEQDLRIAAVAFEAQCGIIIANKEKNILLINQAVEDITGYSFEDAVGQHLYFLHSDQHDENFCETLWAFIANKGNWQGELWVQHKHGGQFPILLAITAVMDTHEHITHYVASFTDISIQKQAEKVLLDSRQSMQNTVTSSKEELKKNKQEIKEINTTLNVLLKHQESDKTDAQKTLSLEVEETILPFLKNLRGASTGRRQTVRLIDILETNLQHLVDSYGHSTDLAAAYHQLTPVETQVASMVRQGLATKSIATTLNISSGTVDIHRKHIRKKLGLSGHATNLQSYLRSLTE